MRGKWRPRGEGPPSRKMDPQAWEWIRAHAARLWDSLQLETNGETLPIRVAILTAVVDVYCQASGIPLPELKFTLDPDEGAGEKGGGA